MTKIFFKPYVPDGYKKGIDGKKLLVLGESHYCERCNGTDCAECSDKDSCDNFTTDVVQKYLGYYVDKKNEYESWMSTFIKFEKAMTVGEPSNENNVWTQFAFYNYFQRAMNGPRQSSYNEEDYRIAVSAFEEVLEDLRPDKVIGWGKKIREILTSTMIKEQGENISWKDEDPENTWIYTLKDGHKVHFLFMPHPAGGFSYDEWHPYLMKFMRAEL